MEPLHRLDIRVAARVFTHTHACIFGDSRWSHAQDIDGRFDGCAHICTSITGPLQSFQRAEYWGVTLALQAFFGIHVGIDNLNVLRSGARLLQQNNQGKPLPLIPDGDLLATIRSMLSNRGMPRF